MHIRNKFCNSHQACNFIKKRLQCWCFPVNIPKVLGAAFFIEQLRWLLLNYALVSEKKNLKEKLVEGVLLISLACFIYKYKSLQTGQLPQENSSFL